jgi:3-oxoacid CoA-transferase subunit B
MTHPSYRLPLIVSILAAMELLGNGDLANWTVPGKMATRPGSAMDLVARAKRNIVLIEHVAKDGSAKFHRTCILPPTGVNMLITDLAVFERQNRQSQFELIECASKISADRIRGDTEGFYLAGQPA